MAAVGILLDPAAPEVATRADGLHHTVAAGALASVRGDLRRPG